MGKQERWSWPSLVTPDLNVLVSFARCLEGLDGPIVIARGATHFGHAEVRFPMHLVTNDPHYWQNKVEEAWAIATEINDAHCKAVMVRIAQGYEKMVLGLKKTLVLRISCRRLLEGRLLSFGSF